jgi:hypothetical protein
MTLFQNWKDQRDQIDGDVKEIQYLTDSAKLASNVCTAATPFMDAANRELVSSIDLMRQKRSQKLSPATVKCAKTPTAAGCDIVKSATAKIADLETRYTNYSNLYWSFVKRCPLAYSNGAAPAPVSREEVTASVNELQRLGGEFKSLATAFQADMVKVEATFK